MSTDPREDRPEDLPEAGDPTKRPPEEHLDPTNPESAAMAPGNPGDGDDDPTAEPDREG
jgi:hypothetical protein